MRLMVRAHIEDAGDRDVGAMLYGVRAYCVSQHGSRYVELCT